MAQKLKFGNGTWATKEGSTLAYNDENEKYKPLPFNFERNSIATRVNKKGLIEVVGNDIPRIDYTDSTEGALLLENSATNKVPYSEDFNNSNWSKGGNTTIESGYLAPDGSLNAHKITCTDNSGIISKGGSLANDVRTIYAKTVSGTGTAQLLSHNSNTNNIFTITEQWQRFELNSTPSVATNFYLIDFRDPSQTITEVILWGAQAEVGNVATSYIPTNGSTVQRAAETANDSGNSEVFNDSEGVLFANIAALSDDSSYKTLSLNDNSTSDRIQISINSNDIYIAVIDGGVTQVFDSASVTDATNFNKVVVSYKVNDCNLWINGFKVFTDTNASMPSGLSQINFNKGDGADDMYCKTKEIGYYDTALTDAELETLTSYRSLNELVTELNLNTL